MGRLHGGGEGGGRLVGGCLEVDRPNVIVNDTTTNQWLAHALFSIATDDSVALHIAGGASVYRFVGATVQIPGGPKHALTRAVLAREATGFAPRPPAVAAAHRATVGATAPRWQ